MRGDHLLQLEAQEFAFFLGTNGAAGELVLGGVDPNRYRSNLPSLCRCGEGVQV
jgi:hypothetical protein